ncbi:MAG: sodium-translocating pyrophosphatase [Planctomycetes bacterium]|nr:sodium-translocating pyrophosphatase [Planctomycetota bacterium]
MVEKLPYFVPGAGLLALLFALFKTRWINRQSVGSDRMREIAGHIREGAMAFLARQYRVLAVFVLVVAGLLAWLNLHQARFPGSWWVSLAFVCGAVASSLAGYFGMRVATAANVRTAHAAQTGLASALGVAFSGGAVMGMSVVGLGTLGVGVLHIVFQSVFGGHADQTLYVLTGFSLGASSIALFARVGGGIYTKAADVGADLVGKVEAGIPEDDPRNPAVIADNVGDNVGDVAGMGADLFESYVGSVIGAMVIAASATVLAGGPDATNLVLLPLLVAATGIGASILGTFLVRTSEGGNPQTALNMGTFGAGALMLAATWALVRWLLPGSYQYEGVAYLGTGVFWSTIIGLGAGILIGLTTEYYTSESRGPAREVSRQSQTGAATNLIAGLALGMKSTAIPLLLLAAAIVGAHHFGGLYGIAMAALGMLSTTGIQLAVDAYGPIADNAGGIAEMAHLGKEVRGRTDRLDAVGNTTAAIGKGFAIGSAALTALALFSAFRVTAGIQTLNVLEPHTMAGVFIGTMLPFLFSSMSLQAVGRAAMQMVEEVRRQFREIPGLREGHPGARADFARCVEISTGAAIREMVVPGLLAILAPVVVGIWNVHALGGLLVGVTTGGVLLAIFMANAGGAWDNAKKHIEGGAYGGKGSDPHKAAVVGDTVGDPFKDTAGPSINILIKLMSIVALILAPSFRPLHDAVAGLFR